MQIDMMQKASETAKETIQEESKVSQNAAVKKQQSGNDKQKNGIAGTALEEKEPSKETIDSVVSGANQRIKMTKTRCEYSYDEPTKRVCIKIFDDDSGEMIREVPPEKSLEMLQKMWELAGIIVDEKG